MRGKLRIRCKCGHRISGKEVLRQGIFMSHWQPLYAYVRYRCSRCKRIGEKLVDYRLWGRAARRSPSEVADEERARFERMGPITANEVIEFARTLERSGSLDVTSLKA